MTNNKIAFKPHETRGQEIINILEGMGGINKYNLDGSKGIIAIDYSLHKSITNDWDYCGLLLNGWEIYNLEAYEKMEKTAENFAVDALTKKMDCYFDELDVENVTEAYIAGYNDCNQNRRLETEAKFKEFKEIIKKKTEEYIKSKTELGSMSKLFLSEGFVDGMLTAFKIMEEMI